MKRLRAWILFGLLPFFALRSEARVFIITNTADTTNVTSLRGAIIAANQLGGHNTILFQPPSNQNNNVPLVFHLTISGPLEDHAQTGDLDIERGTLTIDARRQDIVIAGSGLGDRIFQVLPKARLTLIGLTLEGGQAPAATTTNATIGNGGAILNLGILNAQKCVFTGNASGDNAIQASGPTPADDGGAIYNLGKAVLANCIIERNFCGSGLDTSSGGRGGGIRNDGTCILTLCTISQNQSGFGGADFGNYFGNGGASGDGGGIYNLGAMMLNKCIVSGNICPRAADGVAPEGQNGSNSSGGEGGNGGGIFNWGQLRIDSSSIYNNRAGDGGNAGGFYFGAYGGTGGSGGGIFNQGTVVINDTTISTNRGGNGGNGGRGTEFNGSGAPGGNGGGVFNRATASLTACTIVLNQTGNGGNGGDFTGTTNMFGNPVVPAAGGWGGDGGGIYNLLSVVTIRSTLIALNATGTAGAGGSPGGFGPDGRGILSSGGFNLIGIGDENSGFVGGTNSDIVGTPDSPIDPLIGRLQLNGGPTPTHALLSGSPAIDQGKNFKNTRDQRGQKRRVDLPSHPECPRAAMALTSARSK